MTGRRKRPDKQERPEAPGETAPETEPGPEPEGAAEEDGRLTEPTPDLADVAAERDELRDRWLRAAAELENVRKRSRREVEEARLYALSGLLRDLLEVQDNLGLALRPAGPAGEVTSELESLRAGVALIRQRLVGILGREGLQEIPALGEPFDPARHEAVSEMDVEGVPSGRIVEVVQTGYMLRDRVLRPSRVVVAR